MKKPLPKYQAIVSDILHCILSDKTLRADDAFFSEYALSERYDTTRTTITKAVDFLVAANVLYKLPKRGVFIRSPLNAELYLAQLEERGRTMFLPDANSSSRDRIRFFSNLQSGRFCETKESIYAHDTLQALHKYAATYPCDFVYASAREAVDLLQPECMQELRRDGLLWSAPREYNRTVILELIARGVKVMLMESGPWDNAINYVFSDEYHAAQKAVRHLLDLGHRRIDFFYAESKANSQRIAGIKNIYSDDEIPQQQLTIHDVEHATSYVPLLTTADRPSAIIASSQRFGLEVIAAARQIGLRVPEDLSVICFDDSYELAFQPVAVTAIKQPLEEIVFTAVNKLLAIKRGDILEPVRCEDLKSELMVRNSVAYAPNFRPSHCREVAGITIKR